MYTARLCLIFGGSSAPPIQPLPLPAMRMLSGSITSSTASINPLQICCSGGHRTTTAAPRGHTQQLLLRRPLPNYCFSGPHRATAAAAAIALASSFSSIFDSTAHIALSSLDAAVPTSRSWLGGRFHFCGEPNLSSHLQKLADFL